VSFSIALACASSTPIPQDARQPAFVSRDIAEQEFLEYCRDVECRSGVTIELVTDDGGAYESYFEAWPPIIDQNGIVNILPNDEIHLIGEVDDENRVAVRVSESGAQPRNGISLKFWQETSMSAGSDMMLRVNSTFDRPVKFNLHMMPLGSGEIEYTSSCPVPPGVSSFEHWPYAIFQLLASDFRLLEASNELTCE
jgi:hypothetical protein